MYISEEGDKLIAVLHMGQDAGPVLFMRAIYNWEANEMFAIDSMPPRRRQASRTAPSSSTPQREEPRGPPQWVPPQWVMA